MSFLEAQNVLALPQQLFDFPRAGERFWRHSVQVLPLGVLSCHLVPDPHNGGNKFGLVRVVLIGEAHGTFAVQCWRRHMTPHRFSQRPGGQALNEG